MGYEYQMKSTFSVILSCLRHSGMLLRGGYRKKSDCCSPQYKWAWPLPVGVVKISKFCQTCRKKQMNYKELFIHMYVNKQYIYRVSKMWFTATCKHKYLWQYRVCTLVSG